MHYLALIFNHPCRYSELLLQKVLTCLFSEVQSIKSAHLLFENKIFTKKMEVWIKDATFRIHYHVYIHNHIVLKYFLFVVPCYDVIFNLCYPYVIVIICLLTQIRIKNDMAELKFGPSELSKNEKEVGSSNLKTLNIEKEKTQRRF